MDYLVISRPSLYKIKRVVIDIMVKEIMIKEIMVMDRMVFIM